MAEKKKSFGPEGIFTNPIFNLVLSAILAVAFLYSVAHESVAQAFGKDIFRVIVLAEFLSAITVALEMGLTGKLIYKLINSFSIKIILAAIVAAILIFNMVDQIFVFFLLALLFFIIDLYAVEIQEKYYKGNIFLVIVFFAAIILKHTNSLLVAGVFLFQYIVSSANRKLEPYDWLIFFLYFIIPVSFYGSGNLFAASVWMGLYFIFKSISTLLKVFGKRIFDIGERVRNIFGAGSDRGKFFWSAGEEMLFLTILLAPAMFRFFLNQSTDSIMLLWAVIMFAFVAGSLLFIDPEWWRRYRKHK